MKINHGDYRIFSTRALNEQQYNSGKKAFKRMRRKKRVSIHREDLTTSDSVIVMLFCSTPSNRNTHTHIYTLKHNNGFTIPKFFIINFTLKNIIRKRALIKLKEKKKKNNIQMKELSIFFMYHYNCAQFKQIFRADTKIHHDR